MGVLHAPRHGGAPGPDEGRGRGVVLAHLGAVPGDGPVGDDDALEPVLAAQQVLQQVGVEPRPDLFDRLYVGSVVINAAAGRYYEPAPERTISVGLSLTTGR